MLIIVCVTTVCTLVIEMICLSKTITGAALKFADIQETSVLPVLMEPVSTSDPQTVASTLKSSPYYITHNQTISRRSIFGLLKDIKNCSKADKTVKWTMKNLTVCKRYWMETNFKYRIYLDIFNASNASVSKKNDDVITLVTQLNMDRFYALKFMAEQWPGHISAAIYFEYGTKKKTSFKIKTWIDRSNRSNIAVALVQKRGVRIRSSSNSNHVKKVGFYMYLSCIKCL